MEGCRAATEAMIWEVKPKLPAVTPLVVNRKWTPIKMVSSPDSKVSSSVNINIAADMCYESVLVAL